MRAIDCDQIATPELAVSGECTCASELSRYRSSHRNATCLARLVVFLPSARGRVGGLALFCAHNFPFATGTLCLLQAVRLVTLTASWE